MYRTSRQKIREEIELLNNYRPRRNTETILPNSSGIHIILKYIHTEHFKDKTHIYINFHKS